MTDNVCANAQLTLCKSCALPCDSVAVHRFSKSESMIKCMMFSFVYIKSAATVVLCYLHVKLGLVEIFTAIEEKGSAAKCVCANLCHSTLLIIMWT